MSFDLSHYINSNSLFYIDSDIIDIYNLNSASHKVDFYTDFDFHKDCSDFMNVTLAYFV